MRYIILVICFCFICSCTNTYHPMTPSTHLRTYNKNNHYIGYQVINKYGIRYYDRDSKYLGKSVNIRY